MIKEITIINGQYTDAKSEKKNRYVKIGNIIDTKNGDMIKLDVIPLMDGGWNGWAYINEPRQEDAPKRRNEDEDLPF